MYAIRSYYGQIQYFPIVGDFEAVVGALIIAIETKAALSVMFRHGYQIFIIQIGVFSLLQKQAGIAFLKDRIYSP